jgi:hypothetical protein
MWADGQPDNASPGGHCAFLSLSNSSLSTNRTLFSAACNSQKLYICEVLLAFTHVKRVAHIIIWQLRREENRVQLQAEACKMNVKIYGTSVQVWTVHNCVSTRCDIMILAELDAILIDGTPLTYRTKVVI